MNILIVDDCAEKRNVVIRQIREATSSECIITEATNFIDALTYLRSNNYDLLILDLLLPLRNDSDPHIDNSRNLLREIVEGEDCIRPRYIVSLSEYEDASLQFTEWELMSIIHRLLYSLTDAAWRSSLSAKIRYIQSSESEAFRPPTHRTDILIVTSSPHAEIDQVSRLPGFNGHGAEFSRTDSLFYYSGIWKGENGREITVTATAAPTMGMCAAAVTAMKAIYRYRPRYLIMTGITAGTKKESSQIGDILVAESVFDYGSGKIIGEGDARRFLPSPQQLDIDVELAALLQKWEREQLNMSNIKTAWTCDDKQAPKLVVGQLATGAAVVQSQELIAEILSQSRKVVGLEMEAYAIMQAGRLSPEPRPKVLVVKSICDFADIEKSDAWHRYAAFTSARFVYEFFTKEKNIAWD